MHFVLEPENQHERITPHGPNMNRVGPEWLQRLSLPRPISDFQ